MNKSISMGKDSARLRQIQIKACFYLDFVEAQPILFKDSARLRQKQILFENC
jgi:hypothetical protein